MSKYREITMYQDRFNGRYTHAPVNGTEEIAFIELAAYEKIKTALQSAQKALAAVVEKPKSHEAFRLSYMTLKSIEELLNE